MSFYIACLMIRLQSSCHVDFSGEKLAIFSSSQGSIFPILPPLEHIGPCGVDAQAAKRLLEAGADPNAANSRAETPLQWAAWSGSRAMVELLLGSGAKLHDRDAQPLAGWTALHCAALQVCHNLHPITHHTRQMLPAWHRRPTVYEGICMTAASPDSAALQTWRRVKVPCKHACTHGEAHTLVLAGTAQAWDAASAGPCRGTAAAAGPRGADYGSGQLAAHAPGAGSWWRLRRLCRPASKGGSQDHQGDPW